MLLYTELTPDYLGSICPDVIRTNKKIEYLNIEASFDIETSSTYTNGEKVSFMYIWQLGLGFNNPIFYGRNWDQLYESLELISGYYDLSEDKRLIIYVHNLGYEFQFMRKHFDWLDIFAVGERKPIKALTSLGIEFRDSLILSGYSLENTAKNLAKHKVKKMVGDLDYSLIRTQETPLTEKEMGYCENDIVVILAYINEQIEQYGDITKIPLTNTGRVRDYVRENCYYTSKNHRKSSKGKWIRYRKIMGDLTLNLKTYKQLKRAFMGGFTHSNHLKTNEILRGVDSVDLTSSYPTVMLSDKFPMSRGKEVKVDSIQDLKYLMNNYCVLFDLKLQGVNNKLGYESYLSESKCITTKKPVINNGRIYSAEELTTTITDVDFLIMEEVYSWEKIAVSNVVIFHKNYLPKSIIESILNLYEKKTTLKDVEGSEVEYLLSKGMLNSVYGMCVTDFIKDDHVYEKEWETKPVDVNEKIDSYNKSMNRFLYYPWGIWVTAYARRNLWNGILSVGDDYIYSDTDSIKMLNYDKHKPFIEKYNETVLWRLGQMMKYHKLDIKRLTPKTIKGIDKPLGVWEHEGHYDRFKTLGAKRYMYQQGDKYSLTVAGLSKKNGMEYIQRQCKTPDEIFNFFNDEMYIPKTETGKMTHTYLDKENDFMIVDYLGKETSVKTLSGVHLENCDFTLSISKQYSDFIRNLAQGYIYKGQKNV